MRKSERCWPEVAREWEQWRQEAYEQAFKEGFERGYKEVLEEVHATLARLGLSLPVSSPPQVPAEGRTLAEAFEELRRICDEEDHTLEIPSRQKRPNPFPDALD